MQKYLKHVTESSALTKTKHCISHRDAGVAAAASATSKPAASATVHSVQASLGSKGTVVPQTDTFKCSILQRVYDLSTESLIICRTRATERSGVVCCEAMVNLDSSFLFLVAMPLFLLLVTTSKALVTRSDALVPSESCLHATKVRQKCPGHRCTEKVVAQRMLLLLLRRCLASLFVAAFQHVVFVVSWSFEPSCRVAPGAKSQAKS